MQINTPPIRIPIINLIKFPVFIPDKFNKISHKITAKITVKYFIPGFNFLKNRIIPQVKTPM